jgi:DNA-binding MarR family transcriptional regulator
MPQKPGLDSPRCLDLDNYVPGLVTWLSNRLSAGSSKLYRERHGLGVIEWRVMASICAEEGCTAVRICQVVGLDKGAVSRSLALLTARGLVEASGRAKPLCLTPAGRDVHDSILDLALAREHRLLAGLSAAEIAEFVRVLHILLGKVPETNAFTENVVDEST